MCCPPDLAGDLWPSVRPMVCAAYDRTDLGLATDLDTDVMLGAALLWIAHSDAHGIECAAVTRLEITQHSKVCFIPALGGTGSNHWLHLIKGIEEYAAAEGCDAVRWMGRKGWKRKLPDYREIGVIMERKLDGRHQ